MKEYSRPNRYGVITEKNPREILLLRGNGCKWKQCRFCDYYLDSNADESLNFQLNKKEIEKVTGTYGKLEVVNSGSFVDLDTATMAALENVCIEKKIDELHFESHWMHRDATQALRDRFEEKNIHVKLKIGVETFDHRFRESYLNKGIDTDCPTEIAEYFDEVCLLQGIPGQNVASMLKDITIGLAYFDRVCINIMSENSSSIQPDPSVIAAFKKTVLPLYQKDARVDILLENTDFGVGGVNIGAD